MALVIDHVTLHPGSAVAWAGHVTGTPLLVARTRVPCREKIEAAAGRGGRVAFRRVESTRIGRRVSRPPTRLHPPPTPFTSARVLFHFFLKRMNETIF